MPLPERYNSGYNLGVGGAVVKDGKLLLVRRSSRRGKGNWQVPGGFVEQDEAIEDAVLREVQEEANITARVVGVLGMRNRYDADTGNSMYVVMLLEPMSGEPTPDDKEVDRAEYFTMDEINALYQVPAVNLEIAERALAPDQRLLGPKTVPHVNGGTYTLFVG